MLRADLFDVLEEFARRKNLSRREALAVAPDDAAPERESSARAFADAKRDRRSSRAEAVADAKHFARLAETRLSRNENHHVFDDPSVERRIPVAPACALAIVAVRFDVGEPDDPRIFFSASHPNARVRVVAFGARVETVRRVVLANRANESHRE